MEIELNNGKRITVADVLARALVDRKLAKVVVAEAAEEAEKPKRQYRRRDMKAEG